MSLTERMWQSNKLMFHGPKIRRHLHGFGNTDMGRGSGPGKEDSLKEESLRRF